MEKTNLLIADKGYVGRWYSKWHLFGFFFGVSVVPAVVAIFFAFVFGNPLEGQESPAWEFTIISCGTLLTVLLFLIGLFGRITLIISRRIKYKIWSADYHSEWVRF
jgi:uncharacterized membrane protein YiaA